MINQDFKDFIKLLNEKKVEYLVVGGYAVGFHGFPRYTGDIDIWIKISEENAKRMVDVLTELGFASLGAGKNDFLKNDNVIQLGNPPIRIDILMSIEGVGFDECYKKKATKQIDEIEINFIGFNELLKNKKAVGRDKDLIDIKNLKPN